MSTEHDDNLDGAPRDGADKWRELDDTLADGPSPAEVPEDARDWLAEQRVIHGLLRASHTADASARESRIAAVLDKIDGHEAAAGRRHWVAVALAASLLATIGVWFALPPSLPTAEAAMAKAVDQLARNVDRHYHVTVSMAGRRRPQRVFNEFDLMARPGKKFLIEGRFRFGDLFMPNGRVGCDGETIWVEPKNGRRRSGPVSEREQLLEGLGDILDDGYLDLHSLVENLPDGFFMRVVDRSVDSDGRNLLHIKAGRRRKAGPIRLRRVQLVVDEDTGMIRRLEAGMFMGRGGPKNVVVEYRGQPEPGSVDYSRPW